MIPRYSKKEMADIWSDEERFNIWLEIETLAMEAMVEEGMVPKEALTAVKKKGAFSTERVLEIEETVKHDVIAFLTNVAEHVGEEARYLHLGMTSSDLLDTSFAVQLCRATDLILKQLDQLMSVVKDKAHECKSYLCIGRSHGIHAEPMSFGLKFASWYAELDRRKKTILDAREQIAVGAISGPVGTFAHLSPNVEAFVCEKLGFKPDPVSTQVIARDRHATLFTAFASLGAAIERIAIEIRHLQRTEVREVEEFFSKGQKGSSAMPHKRNPVLTENVTGLSRLLRGWASTSLENIALWHERDISHSSVERVIAPDATITLHFMLVRMTSVVRDLLVYPEKMKENLEKTGGLVFSGTLLVELAKRGLSREDAYALVQHHAMQAWEDLSKPESERVSLKTRVSSDEKISGLLKASELDEIFSFDRHTKQVDYIFNRVFK